MQVSHLDGLTERRRVDHQRATQRYSHVMNPAWDTEEHQIARNERNAGRQQRSGVVLGLRSARNRDTGCLVGSMRGTGTVEPGVPVTTPHIRLTKLRASERHSHQRPLAAELFAAGLNR